MPADFHAARERHTMLGSLSDKQFEATQWCWEHAKLPTQAVEAGVLSKSSLTRWGGQGKVLEWVGIYGKQAPLYGGAVAEAIAGLVPDALRLLSNGLIEGSLDKSALDAAKYILDAAAKAAPPVKGQASPEGTVDAATDELTAALRLVQS